MACETRTSSNKSRKCGEDPSDQSSALENESFKSEYRAAGVTAACCVALLESPRACRVALAKYGTSI